MSTTQSVYTFFSNEAKFAKKIIDKQRLFFFLHHKQTSNWKVSNCKQYWLYFLRVFFCNVNEIVKKEDEYNYTYVFACSSKNVTYKYVGVLIEDQERCFLCCLVDRNIKNKRSSDLDGNLSPTSLRLTCQGVSCLPLKLHFEALSLI